MNGYRPTRRDLLRDGATLAAAGVLASGCAPADDSREGAGSGASPDADARERAPVPTDLPESTAFPLGVASGDVDSRDRGRTILWARHAGATPLRLVVWERGAARTAYEIPVAKSDGGFVHADVPALRPGVAHQFAFTELAEGRAVARSPIGGFRAPRAEDEVGELTVGAYACTKQGRDLAALARAAERELDAVLLLGDGAYNDGLRTLEQYRASWAQNLSTAAYRAIRGRVPYIATWDDHDVDNNWDPETIDAGVLAAATRAFFEHQPIRRQASAPDRVWRTLRLGATLEVFVLDCKSERRRSKAQYIAREQMDWLKAGLDASPCAFKLVMSSLPIGDFPWTFDLVKDQRWAGYPAQRDEILAFIDGARIEGLVWLAGDFHLGSVGRVAKSGLGAAQWEILCGPGAQRGNPLVYTLGEEQWPFATNESNVTDFHLDPKTGVALVRFIDGEGRVLGESKLFA